jgi:hypothetical protein
LQAALRDHCCSRNVTRWSGAPSPGCSPTPASAVGSNDSTTVQIAPRHIYISSVLDEQARAVQPHQREDAPAGSSNLTERAVFRDSERELNGHYEAPLPSPGDREHIWQGARPTQQEFADTVYVRLVL